MKENWELEAEAEEDQRAKGGYGTSAGGKQWLDRLPSSGTLLR